MARVARQACRMQLRAVLLMSTIAGRVLSLVAIGLIAWKASRLALREAKLRRLSEQHTRDIVEHDEAYAVDFVEVFEEALSDEQPPPRPQPFGMSMNEHAEWVNTKYRTANKELVGRFPEDLDPSTELSPADHLFARLSLRGFLGVAGTIISTAASAQWLSGASTGVTLSDWALISTCASCARPCQASL